MDKKELAFKCAICGTWHNNILDRAKCEIACTEKKAEEERKAAEAKKAAEYNARKAEVDAAFDLAYDLRKKFLEDYGSYIYSKTVRNTGDLDLDLLDTLGWLM